ncbi:MAG: DUF2834 domain-containing protein [Prochlorococcus sp.]
MPKLLPWIYLILSILGAVLPWQANLEFIQDSPGQGFNIAAFFEDASLTAASRSLSRDLLIGASAVSIWIVVEARRLKIKGWWIALIACVTISFACGAPLFLFLRERHLAKMDNEDQISLKKDKTFQQE